MKHSYALPKRTLVAQDDAAIIQRANVPRSKFNNRWNRLTTFDAGFIYPFLVDEILPGDHMRYNITAYIRMATALFPVFSNQRFDTHIFFVPCRLLWTNWVRFMGEQDTPASSINFTIPNISLAAAAGGTVGGLFDHLGLPVAGQIDPAENITVNVLPARAYNLIWNTWFRDQNVQNPLSFNNGNGPDNTADYAITRRNKSHDYFTSALPWPQKFTPLQTLFTGTAPIIGLGTLATSTPLAGPLTVRETVADISYPYYMDSTVAASPGAPLLMRFDTGGAGDRPRIYADLAQATGVTINALRQAWLVQDLLERDARGGTRYVELIRSHFGVTNPDFRLQRPEYIGGGQTPINVTPVAQTATGGGGLGALGGVGTAAGSHTASYAATEHGYILGLLSVRSELAYQQGIHRMWTRAVRQDFYFPALAGLGEQAILRQEIFANGIDAQDTTVFGYQERWHEYRTRYSEVTNMFRSTTAGNIDEWHLAQQFAPAPTLSDAFLKDTPPMDRILAAGASSALMQYLADIMIERTAVRPITMFGTPATLARF